MAQLTKEATAVDKADPSAAAIARGVDYLKKETAKWSAAPACASCTGDGARALLAAAAKGYDPGATLDDTVAFLKQSGAWDQRISGGDKSLARIQFASALAVAERHGKAAASDLEAAAKLIVADQKSDGSWGDPDTAGSPATYGTILATWTARSTLIASGIQPDFFSVVQADRWIRSITPETTLDAAATILALELSSDVMAENLRRTCLGMLRSAQKPEVGGWARAADAAPQVFETAIAVLALGSLETEPRLARSAYTAAELKDAIANGKKFLVAQQKADGSWPEAAAATQDSYPQRISTSAWAILALLA